MHQKIKRIELKKSTQIQNMFVLFGVVLRYPSIFCSLRFGVNSFTIVLRLSDFNLGLWIRTLLISGFCLKHHNRMHKYAMYR